MNYYIDKIEYYLPRKLITNEYLSNEYGIDANFLENKIGIKERHVAACDESTSRIAFESAVKLFENKNNNIDTNEIDLLILCTQNPDYRLPTTACLLQHNLNLKTSCMAFDINLGCSGFVYSLVVAGNFIKVNMVKNVLVIMADEYSKIIDYQDRNTASLFGDAASSILLKPCEDDYGIIDSLFGTDGSGADSLILYNSGVVKNSEKSNFLFMEGREIFKFSITVVPDNVRNLLARNNLNIKDIKYFIFHQANKYILKEIQKQLTITDNQIILDMERYGNTVASSIPIAFKNILDQGNLKRGDLLVFCGFGVGLSWGSILYRHIQ
jgi:3-oxoacyl-[acyl-carrier-protein] synthase-3